MKYTINDSRFLPFCIIGKAKYILFCLIYEFCSSFEEDVVDIFFRWPHFNLQKNDICVASLEEVPKEQMSNYL